ARPFVRLTGRHLCVAARRSAGHIARPEAIPLSRIRGMPFEITSQGTHLECRLFGVLTAEDLVRLAGQVEAIEDSLPAPVDRATDTTTVESFAIDFAAVAALAERRRQRRFSKRVRSAIIARRPVEVAFARMYQMLNDNPDIEVRIVTGMRGHDVVQRDVRGRRFGRVHPGPHRRICGGQASARWHCKRSCCRRSGRGPAPARLHWMQH
ncbi:MAG: hypothetical protein L0271_21000, partial [Gemmatimonadetes bacterium]|nr:hypothetical protein [Gemmatimonadota bacterium]